MCRHNSDDIEWSPNRLGYLQHTVDFTDMDQRHFKTYPEHGYNRLVRRNYMWFITSSMDN